MLSVLYEPAVPAYGPLVFLCGCSRGWLLAACMPLLAEAYCCLSYGRKHCDLSSRGVACRLHQDEVCHCSPSLYKFSHMYWFCPLNCTSVYGRQFAVLLCMAVIEKTPVFSVLMSCDHCF